MLIHVPILPIAPLKYVYPLQCTERGVATAVYLTDSCDPSCRQRYGRILPESYSFLLAE